MLSRASGRHPTSGIAIEFRSTVVINRREKLGARVQLVPQNKVHIPPNKHEKRARGAPAVSTGLSESGADLTTKRKKNPTLLDKHETQHDEAYSMARGADLCSFKGSVSLLIDGTHVRLTAPQMRTSDTASTTSSQGTPGPN